MPVYTYVHVEAQGWCWLSLLCSTSFTRQVFSWTWSWRFQFDCWDRETLFPTTPTLGLQAFTNYIQLKKIVYMWFVCGVCVCVCVCSVYVCGLCALWCVYIVCMCVGCVLCGVWYVWCVYVCVCARVHACELCDICHSTHVEVREQLWSTWDCEAVGQCPVPAETCWPDCLVNKGRASVLLISYSGLIWYFPLAMDTISKGFCLLVNQHLDSEVCILLWFA